MSSPSCTSPTRCVLRASTTVSPDPCSFETNTAPARVVVVAPRQPPRASAAATSKPAAWTRGFLGAGRDISPVSARPLERTAGLLGVAGPPGAARSLHAHRQGPRGGQVERVEVDLGEAAVEADRLVGHGEGQSHGVV